VDYAELRKQQSEHNQNHDSSDFTWEIEHCPFLHDGFISPCPVDETKSSLFVSLWFTQGHYQCKILDRSHDERAFAKIESLGSCFEEIETALATGMLDWSPEKRLREGNSFR